jgi:ABC-type Fe3+/spermidine/putrescine transport system ATPase subunit
MLSVQAIYKTFESQPLLKGVSFDVAAHETVCLLGPSGSGKSTLLRIISGLEEAESGRILWEGKDLSQMPVHQRGFGLMFQDYALFPHRTVAENVAFGLRMQNRPKAEIETRVAEALETVNMQSFARRRVTDLSGGEQQRVALARALAPRPRLLMLDEPLGALDRSLREQLIEDLRHLLHSTGIPAIYVTHDQEEAFTIADRLILLHDGKIEQAGTPYQVYCQPSSPWVAGFLGAGNLVEGTVLAASPAQVQTRLGKFSLAAINRCVPEPGAQVVLFFRPTPQFSDPATGENLIEGKVADVIFKGDSYRVEISTSGGPVLFFNLQTTFAPGDAIRLSIPPEDILCFSNQ